MKGLCRSMESGKSIYFRTDGPFLHLAKVYQTLAVSLIFIFKDEIRKSSLFSDDEVVSWGSKIGINVVQHVNEILDHSEEIMNTDYFSEKLNCMVANFAYEKIKEKKDNTSIFEFFRHVRNASSHENKFYFKSNEPKHKAEWRGIVIDNTLKGETNPLFGRKCFGSTLGSADLLALLSDVEDLLPDDCFDDGVHYEKPSNSI